MSMLYKNPKLWRIHCLQAQLHLRIDLSDYDWYRHFKDYLVSIKDSHLNRIFVLSRNSSIIHAAVDNFQSDQRQLSVFDSISLSAQPTWSWNGRYIAISKGFTGHSSLEITDIWTNTVRSVKTAFMAFYICWHPDSTRLVYLSRSENGGDDWKVGAYSVDLQPQKVQPSSSSQDAGDRTKQLDLENPTLIGDASALFFAFCPIPGTDCILQNRLQRDHSEWIFTTFDGLHQAKLELYPEMITNHEKLLKNLKLADPDDYVPTDTRIRSFKVAKSSTSGSGSSSSSESDTPIAFDSYICLPFKIPVMKGLTFAQPEKFTGWNISASPSVAWLCTNVIVMMVSKRAEKDMIIAFESPWNPMMTTADDKTTCDQTPIPLLDYYDSKGIESVRRAFSSMKLDGTMQLPISSLIFKVSKDTDEVVNSNQFVASPDGRYILTVLQTGNLVLYELIYDIPLPEIPKGSNHTYFKQFYGKRKLIGSKQKFLISCDSPCCFSFSPDCSLCLFLDFAGLAQHAWKTLEIATGHVTVYQGFTASPFFIRHYMPFYHQYTQSLHQFSPDSSSFAYAADHQIWIQQVSRKGQPKSPPKDMGKGIHVGWSPC